MYVLSGCLQVGVEMGVVVDAQKESAKGTEWGVGQSRGKPGDALRKSSCQVKVKASNSARLYDVKKEMM